MIVPFILEMQFVNGTISTLIITPISPGQPSLTKSIAVAPITNMGKAKALIAPIILHYITLRSLDKRFIILPNSDDLIIYDVRLDTFAYSSIANEALSFDASK